MTPIGFNLFGGRAPQAALPRIEEYWTAEPVALTAAHNMIALSPTPEEYRYFLVPLALPGVLRLKRAHAVVNTGGVGTSSFAMALYTAQLPIFDRTNPVNATSPLACTRLAILGAKSGVSTDVQRFNATLTKEMELDPSRHQYFLAFHGGDTDAQWFCSYAPTGASGLVAGKASFFTREKGTALADFPTRLTVDTNTVLWERPVVCLRSALGMFLNGDRSED